MVILFVCTGNTCRSPMAAFLLRDKVKQKGLSWRVESAGTLAASGMPMSSPAIRALESLGIEAGSHQSQQVSRQLLEEADYVFTMTRNHRRQLVSMFPEFAGKIHQIGAFLSQSDSASHQRNSQCDIVDPFGGSDDIYAGCASQLNKMMEQLVGALAQGNAKERGNVNVREPLTSLNVPRREPDLQSPPCPAVATCGSAKQGGGTMKIAFGNDHAGFRLKQLVLPLLKEQGFDVEDLGTFSDESVDYPDYALKVAKGVAEGEYDRGVLICGTGLGMCITANKVKGVRAVTVHDEFSAEMARRHNNANVLTLGERVVGPGLALEIIKIFLTTDFEGGRHARRVDKMTQIEGSEL